MRRKRREMKDHFDRVLSSRNFIKLPEFCEAGAADEEIFQESPPHKETPAAKYDENTIQQRIRESFQISRKIIPI